MTDVDFAGLWAEARSLYFAQGFPPYASPAWQALHPDDPQRLAAALDAAEKWRKFGDEAALFDWFRNVSGYRFSAEGRSVSELAEARKARPPRELRPTAGWPPIRIPGGNGRYLTYSEGRAAA
ncbi:hypothetical protein ACFWUZ_20530 [Streptomyces sp. NPDC058646]|uniref:hypothetical protein n=1 Tax=Streptomyces sp. NPDC058646 TaxID=3346574 RepID=UPI003663F145